MHHLKFQRLAAIIIAGTTCLACGGGNTQGGGGGNKAPFTLGISTDLSGRFSAPAGIPCAEGFETYMAQQNAQGGINGHKILLDIMDDRSDVNTGLANYQKVLGSNDLALLLNAFSGISGPISVKAINDHIVESQQAGYMGGVGVYPYIYNLAPSFDQYVATLTAFAQTKVSGGAGKVALIQFDSPLVRGSIASVNKAFSDKGWSIVYNQFTPSTSVDFSVAAGEITSAKPDIIVAELLEPQLGGFVAAVRARGNNAPVLNFNGNISDTVFGKVNDPNTYLVRFTASPTDKSNPAVVAMRDQALQTGHTQGIDNPYFVLCYVHGQVVAQALQKCGDSCTREGLNKAMEETGVDTNHLMAGRPGYSSKDHVMPKGMGVVQWNPATAAPTFVANFGLA